MFEGVITALITPFRDGKLDRDALALMIEKQIQQGISGLVPCGTTGEAATLTHEEHMEVIRWCVEMVRGRVPVIAGTGSNATAETIALTRYASLVGADAALLITPYYNKPTQEGLYQHYRAVTEAVDMPLILYNVPGRTAVNMTPATVARLAELPQVVAIKEATANLEQISRIGLACGDRLTLLSGDDATFLPFLAIGGKGVISVTSNVAPQQMLAVWHHWQNGDILAARQAHENLLELNRLLFVETNPIPVKAAATMLGICGPELRLPLTPLSESHQEPLRQELLRLKLLDPSGG